MKNYKSINIVFAVLVVAALIGGLMLVSENQDSRRGAYFSGTKILVMPETINTTIGSKAIAQIFLETENSAKLSALDTVVCYGPGLTLDSTNPEDQVILNTEALKDLIDVSLTTVNDKPCVRIIALAGATMKPTDLKSGMVKVADLKFDATEVASGTIIVLADKTKVGGYNPAIGATDNSLKVSSVSESNYVITDGTGEPTPTTGGGVTPTTGSGVTPTTGSGVTPTTGSGVTPTTGSGVTPTVPASSDDSVLKFKMAFYGVRGDALCADAEGLPLTVTVRSNDGLVKTYSNIVTTRLNSDGDLALYEAVVPLAGFNVRDGVAVFVKSPKSLQVKYGINGQASYYGIAGGELSGLTNNADSTPVFDFSGYPLLMGDVTGQTAGEQDGVVDGLDFSFIKTESIKRTEVAEHTFMLTDMNGNCKMESQDLANMMLSLSVKQGQLY